MFDDVTYLKLYVSPKEPWDALIKELYSKRVTKKEVKRRIAFLVINGNLGKIQPNKGDTWLMACDTFVQYREGGNWEEEFAAIKQQDEEIFKLRQELAKIEYLKPELVPNDGQTNWSYQYLQNDWKLTPQQAVEEVSLYGAGIIEDFSKVIPSYFNHKEGRYHFVRALHQFAYTQGKNMITLKQGEGSRLFYT